VHEEQKDRKRAKSDKSIMDKSAVGMTPASMIKPKIIRDFKESVIEFKQLDKILPTYALTKGLRVLIQNNIYGSPDKTHLKNVTKMPYGKVVKVMENTAMVAVNNMGETEVSLHKLKFLARPYSV
jgi:hypothetical protein